MSMPLLKIIHRCTGLNLNGRTDFRKAVRAIVQRERQLLLVYSGVNGDYKFPGGGMEAGETHEQTLRRELLEESGAVLEGVLDDFGRVVEYDRPQRRQQYELFCMTSYYYLCRIQATLGETQLDRYEARLEFDPVWVDVGEAIRTNQARLALPKPPFWTARETYVLQLVQARLMGAN
jgi:8-oxo-dGTP diphosphatase